MNDISGTDTDGKASLQLFSQTFHLGTDVNTTTHNSDVGGFAGKAVSAWMEGGCNWILFENQNYIFGKFCSGDGRDRVRPLLDISSLNSLLSIMHCFSTSLNLNPVTLSLKHHTSF